MPSHPHIVRIPIWMLLILSARYVTTATDTGIGEIPAVIALSPAFTAAYQRLSPLASAWMTILLRLGAGVQVMYDRAAEANIHFYRLRADNNSDIVEQQVGVGGDIVDLMPTMWHDELHYWQGMRAHLTDLELRAYPTLDQLFEGMIQLVLDSDIASAGARENAELIEAAKQLRTVVESAKVGYAQNMSDCQLRGLRLMRRLMNNMLRLNQLARNTTDSNKLSQIQEQFEQLYDDANDDMLAQVKRYWHYLRAVFHEFLIEKAREQAMILLSSI